MTVAKVWDPGSSTWIPVPTVGLAGVTDRLAALEAKKGAILDFQKLWSTGSTYRAAFVGTIAYHTVERSDTAGAPFFQINYTSAVPFWWEVVGQVGLIRKEDANYNYIYVGLSLSATDQDGMPSPQLAIFTGHSTVMHYGSVLIKRTFRFPAGSYQVSMIMGGGDGAASSWTYNKGAGLNYLEAKAWAQ